ncbi:hypothetical protein [Phaeocystidibacter luteus]|uniref:Glycosyltransferase RgtA/B/C/D-like domain-containing protein n=1 Tax=Phaeocystidibacter luteus TaxID=911197 RepID=A0A6N6RL35_9FLAO|nr:hypothetical protein [Phaeocystidibacter luteus]KAB2810282.1 hypothetical protein F8C67_06770 [Phaeocystidibacter luteus]
MKFSRERSLDFVFWTLSTLLIFAATATHQPWRDEAQAVMLAQDATGFWDLIQRIRWEGHPMLWFLLIKVVGPTLTPLLHSTFAVGTNALIIFKSGWPRWLKWALPFTYYFAFEYAVIYRDYAVGIFLLFAAVTVWKTRPNLAFILLLLATQANFFALILASTLGVLMLIEDPRSKSWFWRIPVALALLVFTIYQLTPPESGGFASGWGFSSDLFQTATGSVGMGIPIPMFGGQFDYGSHYGLIYSLILLGILSLTFPSTKHRWLFIGSAAVIILFCSIKLHAYIRHTGHVWVLFLLLHFILSRQGQKIIRFKLLSLVLLGQLVAGSLYLNQEFNNNEYSSAADVAEYLTEAQIPNEKTAVFPDNLTPAISLESGHAYYQPTRDTVMTHIIWDAKSQEDVWPKQLKSRLISHFGYGEVYLISGINMHRDYPRAQNDWKLILDPDSLNYFGPSISGESFYLYKIELSEERETLE